MEKMNVTIKDIGSHQAHVMMGTKGYDIHHPMRIPLYLLNNILGGPSMEEYNIILLSRARNYCFLLSILSRTSPEESPTASPRKRPFNVQMCKCASNQQPVSSGQYRYRHGHWR